jgi:hypothetical protein
MRKGRKFVNYVPHNKYLHIDTKGDDYEDYLINLSHTVSVACDKFFAKRGIITINPFQKTTNDDEKNKKAQTAMQRAWNIAKEDDDKEKVK